MPLYEYEEAGSRKFYRIDLDGTRVVLVWGRIGTEGQTQTLACANEAAARAEYERQIARRRDRGYTLVADESAPRDRDEVERARLVAKTGDLSANPRFVFVHRRKRKLAWVEARGAEVVHAKGAQDATLAPEVTACSSPAAAIRERDRRVATLMGQGYELDTFGQKEAPKPRVARPVLAENPALIAAIADDPFDEAAWSVLEDWVLEQGDPRGEMLRAEKLGDKRAEAEARGAALPLLFGERADPVYRAIEQATWRAGFFVEGTYVEPTKHGDTLSRRFYAAPAVCLVRRLEIEVANAPRFVAQLEMLAAAPGARALRTLVVTVTRDRAPADLDLAHLAAIPHLEHLALGSSWLAPQGTARLEALRTLSIGCGTREIAAAWCARSYPALAGLHVDLRAELDALAPLLADAITPSLTTLDIRCPAREVERLREMVRRSRIAARVPHVAVSARTS